MPLGKLHAMAVHFPIALVFSGLLAELLFLLLKKSLFRQAGRYCVVLGGLATLPTVFTGLLAASAAQYAGAFADVFLKHQVFAFAAMSAGLAAGAMAIVHSLKPRKAATAGYWTALLLFALFAGTAGHYGGTLVHGPAPAAERGGAALPGYANRMCPVLPTEEVNPELYVVHRGKKIFVCCTACQRVVAQNPAAYYEKVHGEPD